MKTNLVAPRLHVCLYGLMQFACAAVLAQGTAFTYQGRLDDGANPANGIYDLQFTVHGTNAPPDIVAGPLTHSAVAVSNGLFTVALDFGAAVFPGDPRLLEIAVRTNGGGSFVTLSPRQAITAAPYAITAGNALVANTALGVPANAIKGDSILDGYVVRSINGQTDHLLLPTNFWSQAGNAGTASGVDFLGTTDNQVLDLRVNNLRGLRLLPSTASGLAAPILIGGDASNGAEPDAAGAVIGGGWSNVVAGRAGVVAGGEHNWSLAPHATVAGGKDNYAGDFASSIGGGLNNRIVTNASGATITGGQSNVIGAFATSANISGGKDNTIEFSSIFGTVGGGRNNTIQHDSFLATIGGGDANDIGTFAHYGVIAGGEQNRIGDSTSHCAIGGGTQNRIGGSAGLGVIGGGYGNQVGELSHGDTLGGGSQNKISRGAFYGTIGGGYANTIHTNADFATIPGGEWNVATDHAFAAGRRAQAIHSGAFVWADSTDADFASTANNQFNVRANGGARIVGGGGFANPQLELAQTASDFARLRLVNPSNSWDMAAGTDGALRFYSAGADRLTVSSAGNVTATTFTPTSDRNAKENFAPVSAQEILAKVAALPITQWNFKEDSATRHVGPMAQDFHAAFGLGADDQHIATVDADGVALAAIQGLNQKLAEELKRRDAENLELKKALAALTERVNQLVRAWKEP